MKIKLAVIKYFYVFTKQQKQRVLQGCLYIATGAHWINWR